MAPSVYQITTDQGVFNVTVDEPASDPKQAHMAAAPTSEHGDVLVDNVVDLAKGAVKTAARVGQMIPGMASWTDRNMGLPPGASARATQPSNIVQKVGGLVTDAALAGAIGAADVPGVPAAAGLTVQPKTVAQVAGQAVGSAAGKVADVSSSVIAAVKTELLKGGPLTAEKVGAAIAKYGKQAVKIAASGLGLRAGWDVWEGLHK